MTYVYKDRRKHRSLLIRWSRPVTLHSLLKDPSKIPSQTKGLFSVSETSFLENGNRERRRNLTTILVYKPRHHMSKTSTLLFVFSIFGRFLLPRLLTLLKLDSDPGGWGPEECICCFSKYKIGDRRQ